MPRQRRRIVLSRFFDKNVRLVAGMCERCYEEREDVKIVGVNFIFLKQIDQLDNIIDRFDLLTAAKTTVANDINVECGFSEDERELSVKRINEFNQIVNNNIDKISKVEERYLIFKSKKHKEDVCKGFTESDVKVSSEDVKKVVRVCNQIRCKLYKRISIRALRNIGKSRTIQHNSHKNRSKVSNRRLKDNDSESKYFSIAFDNNNTNVSIKEEYPKVNNIKLENQSQQSKTDCDGCTKSCSSPIDPKLEFIDYESLYFNTPQAQGVTFKTKGSIKIESDSRKAGFEDEVVEGKPPMIFIPPKSPHNLIEEHLYHDPWALLVATIFLNRTSCMCARPYVFWFLMENPDPFSVLEKYPQELEKYFVKLGLQRTRSVQVWRMSHDFVYKKWNRVDELYGIGMYGDDAFRMFCLGDFSVEPRDRFLKIYKAWYEKVAKKGGFV